LDAKNETNQKKQLALFFDKNQINNDLKNSLTKLIKMQLCHTTHSPM